MLRSYQQQAVNTILSSQSNALAVLPTASGKSHIIAELASQADTSVIIFCPSKEILEQNEEKLRMTTDDIGVWSASCRRKEIGRITLATIGSIFREPELFPYNPIVIADECHLIPDKETSMYQKFFREVHPRSITGVTATPFRLFQKIVPFKRAAWKHNRRMFQNITELRMLPSLPRPIFHDVCYNLGIKDLQSEGYLVPLQYHDNHLLEHAQIPLNASHSDFDLEKYYSLITSRESGLVDAINRSIAIVGKTLVFCATTDQARRFSEVIPNSAAVFGDTPKKEREAIIERFKNGDITSVMNFGTMCVGFDFPDLRAVICARPTRSLGLWVQMVGRVLRPAPGKEKGVCIDFSGNLHALGKVEEMEIKKNPRDKWDVMARGKWWNYREIYKFNFME